MLAITDEGFAMPSLRLVSVATLFFFFWKRGEVNYELLLSWIIPLMALYAAKAAAL